MEKVRIERDGVTIELDKDMYDLIAKHVREQDRIGYAENVIDCFADGMEPKVQNVAILLKSDKEVLERFAEKLDNDMAAETGQEEMDSLLSFVNGLSPKRYVCVMETGEKEIVEMPEALAEMVGNEMRDLELETSALVSVNDKWVDVFAIKDVYPEGESDGDE